jgi:2,4-dienoyl-CoA reductase-like NADH-dependent reductase (Old Yellow Enzyme family)
MHLFQPLTLSAITLPNRAVVALDVHGGADDVVAADHAQKAGAGLILTPPLDVERAEIQPWCGVVQAVHDAGGRIAARLSQRGRHRPIWPISRRWSKALRPALLWPAPPGLMRWRSMRAMAG